jgi:SAM-dependent methyltransferase
MPRRKIIPAIHPFDTRHGTDTSGLLLAEVIAEGTDAVLDELTAYYGVAPSILEGIINQWLRTSPRYSIEHYTFLDVGAGKGRAVLLASQFPFASVEGIELNGALSEIARTNIDLWMRDEHSAPLAPITLHNADATIHPLPQAPTLAFLFHPFEAPLLKRFLKHVENHLTLHPNAFDLVYVNSEHGSLLDHHPAFTRLWEGRVPMSAQDHIADLAAIAQQKEYGSTGDELCSVYRFSGRLSNKKKKFAT